MVDARPGRRIAWRAGAGTLVPHEVTIDVFPAPDGCESIVQVVLDLYPSPALPLGMTGRAVRLAADRMVATLLYRLRALMETGEIPMIAGQPSGNPADDAPKENLEEQSQDLMRVVYGGEERPMAAPDVHQSDKAVEQALEESFPASDPPSCTKTIPTPSEDSPAP